MHAVMSSRGRYDLGAPQHGANINIPHRQKKVNESKNTLVRSILKRVSFLANRKSRSPAISRQNMMAVKIQLLIDSTEFHSILEKDKSQLETFARSYVPGAK